MAFLFFKYLSRSGYRETLGEPWARPRSKSQHPSRLERQDGFGYGLVPQVVSAQQFDSIGGRAPARTRQLLHQMFPDETWGPDV